MATARGAWWPRGVAGSWAGGVRAQASRGDQVSSGGMGAKVSACVDAGHGREPESARSDSEEQS